MIPPGTTTQTFPDIDFTQTQPGPGPGGSNRNAPPTPNDSDYNIEPRIGDDGSTYFVEFDPDGVPLGEWHWDDIEEEWIFDDFETPLGALPQTGGSPMAVFALLTGAFCLVYSGSAITRRVSRGKTTAH